MLLDAPPTARPDKRALRAIEQCREMLEIVARVLREPFDTIMAEYVAGKTEDEPRQAVGYQD